ncbi:slipin family protein [Adlercreutzia sp. ZJ138]|uniref:slipin family protein n=1 Tax=Adlercreutzia sp. ZJ138 TaxID=2709405 RepID=UPI0013ECFFD4|nr:slipin family protein [Adlercreutzia sp. ZJ138]
MSKGNRRTKIDVPYELTDKEAEVRAATSYVPRKSSRNGTLIFGIAVFVATCAVVLAVWYLAAGCISFAAILFAMIVALIVLSSTHIALSWEKVVVLRFGKVNRVVGPGLYFTLPVIEHGTIRIDQRTIASPFYAEKTLTADLVPVNIDAVLFWMVWDAEKACTEVEDYYSAVGFLAQTAMREAVGRSTVAEVALRRDQLDAEIKADIEKETAGWGVDIISVKVRDIVIPEELQEAMSLEAQADRERSARMTVVGAEADIAEMLKEAADIYGDPEVAMRLRAMLMQYETVKKSKGSVVTVPTSMSDGFVEPNHSRSPQH